MLNYNIDSASSSFPFGQLLRQTGLFIIIIIIICQSTSGQRFGLGKLESVPQFPELEPDLFLTVPRAAVGTSDK